MAVPFDVERLRTTGTAIRTGETVRIGQEGASYAVSDQGTLVHLPGDEHRLDARLVWVGRDGQVEPFLPSGHRQPDRLAGRPQRRLQPARRHEEIAIADFERGIIPFTSGTTGSQAPVWSPDGRHRIPGNAKGLSQRLGQGRGRHERGAAADERRSHANANVVVAGRQAPALLRYRSGHRQRYLDRVGG